MGSVSDPSDLIAQLERLKLAPPTDQATRKSLYEITRGLSNVLEAPGDSIQRIMYLPLQLSAARLSSDLHIFEILAKLEDGSSLTTGELAAKTGSNDVFLGRILRYLASVGMINEVSDDKFGPSNITKTLAIPGLRGGLYHHHDTIMPAWHALPQFLADAGYNSPLDSADTPFQKAHHTEQVAWVFTTNDPSRIEPFNLWMAAGREGQQIFLDVYPFEKELCHNLEPDTPLFVDVGGGIGHQCFELKKRLPHVPGRVILQDQGKVLEQALRTEGVETMIHDFWLEQPVKGARAYYMRNIMHDFPDTKAAHILQQLKRAMSKDSSILIDDMIIPNKGVHWQAAQLDLTMMSTFAAIERTEKQWSSLLDLAGLKIKQIWTYTPELRDSIIVAVPK